MDIQHQEQLTRRRSNGLFKVLIEILLLCFSTISFAQQKEIIWSDSLQLSWQDFQGKVQRNSTAGAISYLETSYKSNLNQGRLTLNVYAKFTKNKSWVKEDDMVSSTLEHEQLHFDIEELYARKLRKMISETSLKPNNMGKKVNKLYGKILKQKNECQNIYDEETTKPRNETKQKEWNKKIALELLSLEEFSSSELIFDLKKKCKK